MHKNLSIGKNMYKLYTFTNREVLILKKNRYLNIKGMGLEKRTIGELYRENCG